MSMVRFYTRWLARYASLGAGAGVFLLAATALSEEPQVSSRRQAWELKDPSGVHLGWAHYSSGVGPATPGFSELGFSELAFEFEDDVRGKSESTSELEEGCVRISLVFASPSWWIEASVCLFRDGRPARFENHGDFLRALELLEGTEMRVEVKTSHGHWYQYNLDGPAQRSIGALPASEKLEVVRRLSGACDNPVVLPDDVRKAFARYAELVRSRRELREFDAAAWEEYLAADETAALQRVARPESVVFDPVDPDHPQIRKLLERVASGRPKSSEEENGSRGKVRTHPELEPSGGSL